MAGPGNGWRTVRGSAGTGPGFGQQSGGGLDDHAGERQAALVSVAGVLTAQSGDL
ncbi:hypothetical protein GCM10010360_62390 [Streptomyces nogalater]